MRRRGLAALLVGVMAMGVVAGCAPQAERSGKAEAMSRFDFREVVREAKDKVFPAVVYIKCVQESLERGKKISQEVSGSGVIISDRGEVVTNWHVIDKAVSVRCLLYDGRAMNAKVVGSDKDTDLALLALEVPEGSPPLPAAVLGDSTRLAEGDFVMAMGAPWGLSRSVSIGIVACTSRFLPDVSQYSQWLQTDASISPGNSGGPLVHTAGEVSGITARGAMEGGDMGFAVPSATVRNIVGQIREFGKVNWSWTGLQLQPLRDFNRNIYFDATEGVIVSETDPDSPARHAGIQVHDRILRIGDQSLNAVTEEDLPRVRCVLGLLPKFKPVVVELVRGGETIRTELVPREKGRVEGEELDCPRWDMTVKTINQFDNPDLYFHRREGVFIFGVRYPGNASNADLQSQDIILKIDGQPVTTLDEVRKIHAESLRGIEKQHRLMFVVLRNGLMRQLVLDFSRDYEKQ